MRWSPARSTGGGASWTSRSLPRGRGGRRAGAAGADVLAAKPECATASGTCWSSAPRRCAAAQHELLPVEPFEDALGPVVRTDDDAPLPVTGMGPIVTALDELPAVPLDGVVLANELLDNLPFRSSSAPRRLVGGAGRARRRPARRDRFPRSPSSRPRRTPSPPTVMPVGTRLPVPTRSRTGCTRARSLRHGVLVVIDYVATAAELVERGADGWLRTYREHERGGAPLVAPGDQDITIDVPRRVPRARRGPGRLPAPADITQAEWLAALGDRRSSSPTARDEWDARAHVGDLEAVRHRSRVTEAAALDRPRRPRRAPGARLHP